MNSVGLTAVGKLLGVRKRATTAIYAHLDDAALRDGAAQAATAIACAMGYKASAPAVPSEAKDGDTLTGRPEYSPPRGQAAPPGHRTLFWLRSGEERSGGTPTEPRSKGQVPASLLLRDDTANPPVQVEEQRLTPAANPEGHAPYIGFE